MRTDEFVIDHRTGKSNGPSANQQQRNSAETSSGNPRGGRSMRSRLAQILFEVAAVVALMWFVSSCGSQKGCPTCGTTVNGAYTVLDIIPVPEHNPTGEPGGPFNSFDISWFDPNLQRVYTSDRIGLDIVVVDAKANAAINTIGGINAVANAGNNFSPCAPLIPSIVTGQGALRDP